MNAALNASKPSPEANPGPADQPVPPDMVPLSFAQQRLWFVQQLDLRSPVYNVPAAVRIEGDLDFCNLTSSLAHIIQRHEILRTTYLVFDDSPVQKINPFTSFHLPSTDLSALSSVEREHELSRSLKNEASIPFDLKNDLMIRAKLFRMAPQEHVLFVNMHHIACDGWSMELFFRELWHHYDKLSSGELYLPDELPIQYADFASWQRSCITENSFSQDRKYWLEQLRDCPSRVELIGDFVRQQNSATAGSRAHHRLSPELSDSIKSLARKEGVTPFIVLLAAFKLLLHRYSSQEDIAIGTPISGRDRLETDTLIGFFVNLLVLRCSVSGTQTFSELVSRIREVTIGAFSHQHLPFEQLVEALHPNRGATQNPFFNVVFAVQNQAEEHEGFGLGLSPIEVHNSTAKFDLNLTVQETKHGFSTTMEYRTDLFAPATINRMLEQFEVLLSNAVANPAQLVSDISILHGASDHLLLVEWNQTKTDFPKGRCVHELFEEQASRQPGSTAVVYGHEKVSYGELNDRANRLARFLRKQGVGPEKLVGICLDRSVEMIVSMLAVLKAGGAYLPLDPTYPVERLAFMVDDAEIETILTNAALRQLLPKRKASFVLLDLLDLSKEDASNLSNITTSENSIYVIYTSGSTGTPKGICIPHRGVTRLLFNTNYVQLSAEERIAQISNASFDAATFEIWGALLLGGQLIGVPKDVAVSPSNLAKTLREQKITTAFLTTALFNQIAAEFPEAFSSLKNLLFGGEAVDTHSVKAVLKHGPPERLLHVYGPTETTTFASWFHVRELPDNAWTVPIGRPISNTQFYVLDSERRPVPIGMPGELYIGGDGVARGYLRREALTQERFIPNPFNSQQTEWLYKTGDLVRYRDDGNIEFLTRIDSQVKLRGFRIELGEIEAALLSHPFVAECVVVVREDSPGDKRLVGYVVATSKSDVSLADLRAWLKNKLPDYMIPAPMVFLDRLPLNPNGKVDRRALPAPTNPGAHPSTDVQVLARNNLELELTKIWQRVLNVRPIGVKESFFDLGGHSLLAVRLFAQINEIFGRDLPLSTLFTYPTIEDLATLLGANGADPRGSCIVEIQPKGSKPPIFWLHTLGGGGGAGLFTYRKLTEQMDPDQPSFGFVAPAKPHMSLEEMAAHYISELRVYQPHSPYYLGGYCFGGVVAFEMARQLVAMGEEVRLVALLDSTPPAFGKGSRYLRPRYLSETISFLKDSFLHALKLDPRKLLRSALRKLNKQKQKLVSSTPKAPGLEDFIDLSGYPPDFLKTAQTHWEALLKYKPGYYPGTVTLFRARNRPPVTLDPTLGWGNCAQHVEIKVIPGTHETLLSEPCVNSLAEALNGCLGLRHGVVPFRLPPHDTKTCQASKVA